MRKTIIIILQLLSIVVFGQKTKFKDFVNLFPKTTLPTTIKYSESEFKTEYYTPENSLVKGDSIPYHDHVLPKDSSLIINSELVKSFLLLDSEKVELKTPTDNLQSIVFYISSKLIINKNFICLIYERQFQTDGTPNAEKYLCTLTSKGILIDKILVASANYTGTGILVDSFRVPWFPDVMSSINNDLTIKFTNSHDGDSFYQIDKKGKIINKASH